MALKLYKKTIDIWITHICLYVISWELANVLGTWTSLLPLKWWNRCSQNWAPDISALSVPPIGKGLHARNGDEAKWQVAVSPGLSYFAEQRNNQPGRCDVRCRLHTERPRHRYLHAAIFTKRGIAAENLWTQKEKDIRRYNWYTHNEMQTIYSDYLNSIWIINMISIHLLACGVRMRTSGVRFNVF